MSGRRQQSRHLSLAPLVAIAAIAVVASSVPASAQLFNFLFGSPRRAAPPPSASAYADPRAGAYPGFEPSGRSRDSDRGEGGPSVAFCVRLCDGRYFPLQRANGANAAQLCSSFCPASQTRTFSGSRIDHAVASDGSRYAGLQNAFAYRDRTVAGCTCNGRDAYGLVTIAADSDPTLRPGDIVATDTGFVAYNGGGRRQHAEFTPIESLPNLSAEWRQRLAQTRIVPRNATPVPPEVIHEGSSRNRRVQSDR